MKKHLAQAGVASLPLIDDDGRLVSGITGESPGGTSGVKSRD